MSDVIALVFDFDDTLAPDSTSGFLADMGVDVPHFWKHEVDPLWAQEDWDPVPAYLYQMIRLSQSGRYGPITRERLQAWGQRLPLHAGVPTLFERLRHALRQKYPQVQLEFYLISSGIGDVMRHTPIAHEFTDIWASEFVYAQTDSAEHGTGDSQGNGGICFARRIVSFTDKTRYLFHIQKGIVGQAARNKPFEVNKKIEADKLRIPFAQMIFVGDGYTDVPCFSLIRRSGGVAFGVWPPDHRDKRSRAWGFLQEGRVSNMNQARYDEQAELYQMLEQAVESLAGQIALRRHTYVG